MFSKIEINVSCKRYPIKIESGILYNLGSEIKKIYNNKNITIITDRNVEKLYGRALVDNLNSHGYKVNIISIVPGENSKSFETLISIYNQLLDNEMTRKDMIIAFGGGVVGDLAGFAASTFLRGISYIQIPTSLLSQIDSSIGGKVAVNLPRGKNLIGSFHHPEAVYIDSNILRTLPKRYFYDGMAEVIKYACIRDNTLFNKLRNINSETELFSMIEEIIHICCCIKKDIVEKDEREAGDRMLLNFGHTIGHAVEKAYNYEKYTHGEAVAIGMYSITKRSEEIGVTKPGTSNLLKDLLIKFNLPYKMPKEKTEILLKAIDLDKKSESEYINIILLNEIGKSFVKKISKKEVHKFLL